MYVTPQFCCYCGVEVDAMDGSVWREPHASWCTTAAYWLTKIGSVEYEKKRLEAAAISQSNYEKLTSEGKAKQALISRLVAHRSFKLGDVRGDEFLSEGQKRLLRERGCLADDIQV